MIIIGLGTGRCGTLSLVNLLKLAAQQGLIENNVTMHREGSNVPWEQGYALPRELEGLMVDIYRGEATEPTKYYGDVAPYHLPYVKYYQDYFQESDIRFVVLQRDKEETVNSYMHWRPSFNHWQDHDGTIWERSPWDHSYPSYNPTNTKREALATYYDEYYMICELYEERMENFRIFQMNETLNTIKGLSELLEFMGIYPGNAFSLRLGIDDCNPAFHHADYTNNPIDIGS